MNQVIVREMTAEDGYYVGACTHVRESAENDASAERRLAWLHRHHERGVRAQVALLNGERVGFGYLLPIELSPWGPVGRDLMVLPCLYVEGKAQGQGVGRALLAEAEAETHRQARKGLATYGHYWDFWFMPASFFEHTGFELAARRGDQGILWKRFDPTAEPPRFLEPAYTYEPVPGKVAIDLFYSTFCATSDIEAQRVREVAAEYGAAVVLREHNNDDPATVARYQTPRRILVDGQEISWGYEAPRDGIRAAISLALEAGSR